MRRFSRRAWLREGLSSAAVCWMLARPAAAAEEGWIDQRSAGPFLCRASFPLQHYEKLFAELAQLQLDLIRALGIGPTREPIELYLFSDRTTYTNYLRRRFPQVPYRRALFVKSSGPGMVFAHRSDEFEIDLRHESTHALLHGVLPMVPLWLDEGLAEYFEVPAEQRAFDNPHLAALKWNIRLGMLPKLSSLERRHSVEEMGESEYRYSWGWVHFMLHGPPEAHGELVGFLADIQAGVPPGQLSDRLESRLPNVQARLVAHLKGWKR